MLQESQIRLRVLHKQAQADSAAIGIRNCACKDDSKIISTSPAIVVVVSMTARDVGKQH